MRQFAERTVVQEQRPQVGQPTQIWGLQQRVARKVQHYKSGAAVQCLLGLSTPGNAVAFQIQPGEVLRATQTGYGIEPAVGQQQAVEIGKALLEPGWQLAERTVVAE